MNKYWKDRLKASQDKLTDKTVYEINKQMSKYYSKAMMNIIDEFEAVFDKLMTAASEDKPATPADLYKLDKYWKLQNQLTLELEKLGNTQIRVYQKRFMDEYKTIYNSISIKDAGDYAKLDTEAAKQLINGIWCADGKNWSQRVWNNTALLKEALNEKLLDCVITGKKTSDLKKALQTQFNVDYNRANTLVRTEIAHIQTESAKQRYKDNGVEQVQIWADEDERRCDVCGKLHKKIYSIYDDIPIPAHPNCRCCIVPIIK